MAIAFRSGSNTAYAARTNTTITAPAGIANGDILVALMATGAASPPVPSTPTGWTAFGTDKVSASGSGFEVRLRIYWKRAASESGNYTFTHANCSSAGWIGCFSGALASGTPLGATSSNGAGSGTTSTGTGITTTAANSWLLWLGHDWADTTNNLTPPTGMTERLDAVIIYVATELIAAAGATGNRTMTNNSTGVQSAWDVRMVELLVDTGGGDADAIAWRDQVVTNGGSVSAGRLTIVQNFIVAEKAAGTWALTDDYWGLWAENATQALTSLKQRRLATATATPTYTTDRGYAFNGSTQFLNTGFKPATNAVAMTGTNMRLAVWEIANVTANTYAAGTSDSSTVNLHNRPRSTTSCFAGVSSATITYTLPVADSRGLTAVSRNGAGAANCTAYQNAVAMTQTAATTFGSTLPTRDIYIGCYNNIGSAAGFRAASIGFVCVGAALTAGQETSQYNNTQAWAVAVGAATSSGVTGTASLTAAAATGTLAGTVTVGGIVTTVLAPAIVVATGRVGSLSGMLDATLAPATLAAAGSITTPPRTATLNVTLQDATLFAASLPRIAASLNVSLDSATLLARGHVPANWVKSVPAGGIWQVEHGETVRLTEDGSVRITEDGLHYRITEQVFPTSWTRDPLLAGNWTRMVP